MTTDEKHIKAITKAVRAAFMDTECTMAPDEIKQIVRHEWEEQIRRTMRALMEEKD